MKLLSSPNEFLKKVMQPFDFETMDAKQLSGEMCQIMMAKNGLGLAANQVGLETKEGCLSHIGLILTIKRPKNIVVQFLDIDAKECIIELSGIDARCFLHEYDHLNGVEFTDRVSKLKVSMAKKKQRKLIKEHTNG